MPSVDPLEVGAIAEPNVLVDVREPDEWHAGHAPGAVHVPLGQLGQRLGELPADTRLVMVCRSGNRSGRATDALVKHGYDAVNLVGGMQAWARAGLPVVTDDGGAGRVA
ncbi:MAG: rhodanese-like domain-containing protein [Acidimicrobiales bacterium]|nr:rhodanese-like domain-containing protein [Acidimicrobiales bacterium]